MRASSGTGSRQRRLAPLALAGLVALAGCGRADTAPPELRQAARVVRWLSAPASLARSTFPAAFPEGRPSEFVSWMFSPQGTAEWPPADGDEGEFSAEELRAIRATGVPLRPRDVRLVPLALRPGGGKQIVVAFDDARRTLRIQGYVAAEGAPVLIEEWELARVEASAAAKALFESNRGLGASSHSLPAAGAARRGAGSR